MRVALKVAAALCAAAMSSICVARAADLKFGAQKFLFFSGIDLWRHGAFSHGGALWSPDGIDNEGFVLKVATGAGTYRYHSGDLNADVTGHTFSLSLLPGWRFKRGSFIATGFAGLEVQRHSLTPDDTASNLRGTHTGFRGGIEIWYEPTPDTMMSGDASATNIGPSYSARGAFGWRLFDRFYFGPEITGFSLDDTYRQFRVGAHVTALKLGTLEWTAALGWSRDSDKREGIYGRLGVLKRGNLF